MNKITCFKTPPNFGINSLDSHPMIISCSTLLQMMSILLTLTQWLSVARLYSKLCQFSWLSPKWLVAWLYSKLCQFSWLSPNDYQLLDSTPNYVHSLDSHPMIISCSTLLQIMSILLTLTQWLSVARFYSKWCQFSWPNDYQLLDSTPNDVNSHQIGGIAAELFSSSGVAFFSSIFLFNINYLK